MLLLEAGGKDDSKLYSLPAGYAALISKGQGDWHFNTEPMKGAHNRTIPYPRGKVLGGSSSTNDMIYVRGHYTDYDDWSNLGNKGWSYKEILPYFKKSEDYEKGESEYHGAAGPLKVSIFSPNDYFGNVFLEAAQKKGHVTTDDFNGKIQEGFGNYQITLAHGLRSSSSSAFLRPILKRPNLTVLINSQVTKILIENTKAVGVEFLNDGKINKAIATKEILLAAGAVQSPQVLMLSGIGPKEQLSEFGIKIEHELPGVGKNLRDHTSNAIIFHAKGSSLPVKNWKLPFRTLKALFEYLVSKKGMMASNGGINVGGFIRTLPELPRPDIQYHFMGAAGPKEGFVLKPLRAPDDGFTGVFSVLHPHSVGEIRLRSANPLDAPVIDLNFYDDPRDIDAALRGFKILRQILSGDPFNKHAISEIQPGPDVQTDDEIREFLRESVVTIYHPVGTCKMGHDNMAVVDDRLKVHGIESLRVVDASIMPTIVGGNTNAPTFMIAEKAADMILGCFTA